MSNKYKEIGEILAAARREQHKSLKDASEITKIMEHYLIAIEAGEPEKLPSEAYFHLFARSYAQFLGIDPAIFDEIEEKNSLRIKSATQPDNFELEETESVEAVSRAQARRFARSLVYLAAVVFIVFIAFIIYNMFFVEGNVRIEERQTDQSLPEDAQGPAEGGAESESLIIADTPYQPPGKLKLHLIARQDVWAIVVRDGDTVLNRRLDAGSERVWEADYRYHLTVGISTAVDLYVNDLKLAPLSDQARTVSGLEINQINYREFLPGPDDTGRVISPVQPSTLTPPAEPEREDYPPSVPATGDSAADTTDKESFDGN